MATPLPGDIEDSGDFDPPSPPPNITPVERHTFDMHAWFARSIIAEQRSSTRRMAACSAAAEVAAERRTASVIGELRRVREAVGGVREVVDREHLGPLGRAAAWIDTMPAVKASVGMSVAVFVGGAMLTLGAWLGFTPFALPGSP